MSNSDENLQKYFEIICHKIRILKDSSRSIVFTHGAFDLFHYGHLKFLQESSKLGDVLVVGVESDKNISLYKGIKRPIISQKYRVEIIKSLRCVDFAFIIPIEISSQNFIELYKKLTVDVITVGKSFAFINDMKIRSKIVGCRLEVIDSQITSTSTSTIINTINEKYKNN